MIRLAMLLASLSLLGCVTDTDDAATGKGGGGGKADDPTECDPAAYGTWMRETFLPAVDASAPIDNDEFITLADLAGSRPCQSGTIENFQAWAPRFFAVATPLIDALPQTSPQTPQQYGTQHDWDAAVVAATPSEATINLLTVLALAKPFENPKAAHEYWLERYNKALTRANEVALSSTAQLEDYGVYNTAEKPLLEALELAMLDSSEEGAYAKYFEVHKAWIERGFSSTADAMVRNGTSRMAHVRPSARGDIDYLTYLVYFDEQEKFAFGATTYRPEDMGKLTWIIGARPTGRQPDVGLAGGTRSYGPWFERFVSRYAGAISNLPQLVVDAREKAQLDAWLAIKPCSDDPAAERAPWDTVNARRANFGDTVTYFDAAAPVACD